MTSDPKIEKALQAIEKATNRVAEAKALEGKAQAEYDLAAMAEAEGTEGADLEKAGKALERAKTDASNAEAILRGAKVRHGEIVDAWHRAEAARKWADSKKLIQVFRALGKEIEVETTQVIGKLDRLLELGTEIHNVSPVKMDFNKSSFNPNQTRKNFKLLLRKLGQKYAYSWFDDERKIPGFSESIEETISMFLQHEAR